MDLNSWTLFILMANMQGEAPTVSPEKLATQIDTKTAKKPTRRPYKNSSKKDFSKTNSKNHMVNNNCKRRT